MTLHAFVGYYIRRLLIGQYRDEMCGGGVWLRTNFFRGYRPRWLGWMTGWLNGWLNGWLQIPQQAEDLHYGFWDAHYGVEDWRHFGGQGGRNKGWGVERVFMGRKGVGLLTEMGGSIGFVS